MANDHPDDPLLADPADVHAATLEFQRQVDLLRAQGCTCMLRWDGRAAVPFSVAEALSCPLDHYPDSPSTIP